MAKAKASSVWVLVAGLCALAGLIALGVALPPDVPLLRRFIQGAALMGYACVFLAILSSAFLRQLVRFFGRPFVQIHHVVSILGLAMLVAHPTLVAIQSASAVVFAPQFSTLYEFFRLGGRPAWYLLIVGAVAAVLRKAIGRHWRVLHYVNYVALLLATPHALMIGGTFQHAVVPRVVLILMAVATVAAFVQKRLGARARRSQRA
ncbi:MAG: hypothetical protein GX601_04280 [Anaerolineales bacterium]|nr:hypothetical protein [Anaerolineales bacterium]